MIYIFTFILDIRVYLIVRFSLPYFVNYSSNFQTYLGKLAKIKSQMKSRKDIPIGV